MHYVIRIYYDSWSCFEISLDISKHMVAVSWAQLALLNPIFTEPYGQQVGKNLYEVGIKLK